MIDIDIAAGVCVGCFTATAAVQVVPNDPALVLFGLPNATPQNSIQQWPAIAAFGNGG